MAAIKEALINKGYRVVDEQPEDYYYNGAIRRAKDVEAINDDPNEVAFKLNSYDGRSYEKLKYRPDNKKNNEQIAAIKKMKDDIRESEEHRAIWFGDRLDNPAKIPCLVELSVKAFFNNNSQILDHYADDLQVDLECDPCKLALIVGFEHSHRSLVAYAGEVMGAKISQWYAEAFMITATCSMRSSRTDISPRCGSRSCSPRFTRHATALRRRWTMPKPYREIRFTGTPEEINAQW